MTVWCLDLKESEQSRHHPEGRKRKLSERPQGPMLGTNAVFHTTEDTFPQGETGQQLSFTGDGSLGERLSRVLLHSTLKQTPGATALHWQSLWKRRALSGLSSFCSIPRLHREPHDSYLQVLSTALGPQKALPAHSWALLDQCNLVELNSSSQHAASLGLTTSSNRPEHGLWVSKYQRTGSAPRTRV